MAIARALLAPALFTAALLVAACDEGQVSVVGSPLDTSGMLTRSREAPFDVLIVVDDSGSMAPRSGDVPHAVAEMVRRLVEPGCLDDAYALPLEPPTRVDVLGRCPLYAHPERVPILDMNVGVITTSVGAPEASDRCTDEAGVAIAAREHGPRLHSRDASGSEVPTWGDRGFLAWDPEQARLCDVPGGGFAGGYCPGIATADELAARVEAIVGGVGTNGCGSASPLEAAWRFAGDPEPHRRGGAAPDELDAELVAERAGFLREGFDISKLIVVVVTDGDDASFRDDRVGAYLADPSRRLPRARYECATDPLDLCCASCVDFTPDGCPDDGACAAPGCSDATVCPDNFEPAAAPDQAVPDRCVEATRRFGIDPCYPVERYVNAFASRTFNPRRLDLASGGDGDLVNALADHQPELVLIGDVPWETIYSGVGYLSAAELDEWDVWSELLPSVPALPALPTEPRRLLSVVRALGDAAHLASIEPPTFDEPAAGRDLEVGFDAAPQAVAQPAARNDTMLCMPAGVAEPDGSLPCSLFEVRDSDGDGDPATTGACHCDDRPGRATPRGAAAEALAEALDADVDTAVDLRMTSPPYDCICAIPELIGTPEDRAPYACTYDRLPPLGLDGWCYLEGPKGGGALVDGACGADPHAVRLVGQAPLVPGGRLALVCEAQMGFTLVRAAPPAVR